MPKGVPTPRVPLLMRAVILGLHWHGGMSFKVIEQAVSLKERTAMAMVKRAKDRAADSTDFEDILACLDNEHGGRIEPKIPEGSRESISLHDLSQKDEKHWQMPFEDLAKELNIHAARSTLENVFHDHHNIFRRKATHKPYLTAEHIEARLAFAHMALHIAIHHVVFTDEMWVEFNSIRRQRNVSRIPGVDPNEWAIHDKEGKSTIRVMFWGAICLGSKSPCHIWEQDTEEDKKRHKTIIDQENTRLSELQEENQSQAAIPGTWQHEVLIDVNHNIQQQNERERRTGRHKRRRRGPHQVFQEEQFVYRSKGGVNWVSYRERVLQPILYPWIDELQARTGMPLTYLVEDNAPSHQTAQRVDQEERTQRGIITFNWPSKSPDLNQIEPIWSDSKDEICTYQFTEASQETIQAAKATLVRVWEELPQALIDRRCATFHEKLERCILHGGGNNYDG